MNIKRIACAVLKDKNGLPAKTLTKTNINVAWLATTMVTVQDTTSSMFNPTMITACLEIATCLDTCASLADS